MTTANKKEIKTHSPIRWFGGKHFLAKHIIPLFPEHHCFVDVFGGGGHVTVAKPTSKVEIFNDLDNELLHFLWTLRNDKQGLMAALASMPTSRSLFHQICKSPTPADPIERAAYWFYLLRQRIIPTNGAPSGFRYGKVKNSAVDYQNAVGRLETFERRMSGVLLECLDFRDVISKYDGPETLFFLDPPYFGKEKHYFGGFTKSDHMELARMLHQIQGKCLVTYYGDPFILDLYSDFHVRTVTARVGAVVKAELGQARRRETEFFFMNYDPDSLM
ncbi:DNA adenine methylase [Paenibacillus ihuae]|uniref:DNA adenine methylase n=1 Tax=Paenibacillus ihuae TaxID=1232431 RepID=UPI0006D5A9AD|nr:DNA adenine methylase [Paenibacillus ihuae]